MQKLDTMQLNYERDLKEMHDWMPSDDSRLTGLDTRFQGVQGTLSYVNHYYQQHFHEAYGQDYNPYTQWMAYEES